MRRLYAITHEVLSHAITFKPPFTELPAVMLAISMWDTDHAHNTRADLTA